MTGATVHYVDEGMDTGEIIFQKAVDVLDGDTPDSSSEKSYGTGRMEVTPAAINKIANEHAK